MCLQIISSLAGTHDAGVSVLPPFESQGSEDKAFLKFVEDG